MRKWKNYKGGEVGLNQPTDYWFEEKFRKVLTLENRINLKYLCIKGMNTIICIIYFNLSILL